MKRTLTAILAFLLTSTAAVVLFTYDPEPSPVRYDCPAEVGAFAGTTEEGHIISFPACEDGVIAYDIQLHDGIFYFTTTPVYSET